MAARAGIGRERGVDHRGAGDRCQRKQQSAGRQPAASPAGRGVIGPVGGLYSVGRKQRKPPARGQPPPARPRAETTRAGPPLAEGAPGAQRLAQVHGGAEQAEADHHEAEREAGQMEAGNVLGIGWAQE